MDIYTLDQLPEPLRQNIVIDEAGCWLWQGSLDRDGYGIASAWRYGIADTRIHVIVWRMLSGDVPAGHEVHHECLVKRCCYPGHLIAFSPDQHKHWQKRYR